MTNPERDRPSPGSGEPLPSGSDADAPPDHDEAKPSPRGAWGRPKLIETDRGSNAIVRVALERGAERAEGAREAVGEEAMVLRCAAEATLDAIAGLTGGTDRFALVGAKRMLAFDSAVLLVCVRTLEDAPRKLIGCVPIQDDPVTAAARAVLHATNRIVETLPSSTDDEPDG